MIRLNNFKVEVLEDEGCNNGKYPQWEGTDAQGALLCGNTCRCRRGCSNTDAIFTDAAGDHYLLERG